MAEQAVGTDLHLPAASESPALQPPALQQPQMGGTLPLPSAGGFLRRWICFSSQGTCLWSRGWCRGRWRQAQPRQRCNASLQRELLPCLALSGCLNLWSSSSSFMILCAFPCSLITAAYYFTGPQSTARIPVLGLAWGSCLALQCLTHRFQRQGVWGGVLLKLLGLCCVVTLQAALQEAARLRATRCGRTGMNLSGMETAECA